MSKVSYKVSYEYFTTFTNQWFPGEAEMFGDRLPTADDRKEIERVLSKHKGGKSVSVKSVKDMNGRVLFTTGSWSAV